MRILLVEDNAVNQRLLFLLLRKRGHIVTVANNGREALEALTEQPFDLVLMDIEMPVMDGFEALACIRERERATGEHLPIVAVTANDMMGTRAQYLAAGFDGYVPKPVQTEELLQVMAKVTAETKRVAEFAATALCAG